MMNKKSGFLLSVIMLLFIFFTGNINAKNNTSKVWTGSWATAPQLVEPNNMPPAPGLENNSLRQVIRVSIGGDVVRVRFANTFSKQPITLKNVAIAVSKDGSEIDAATQKNLKFSGQPSITIQPGKDIFSDALKFKLKPDSRLAITIAFGDVPDDITGHPGSRTTSFILSGNNVQSVDFAGAIPTDHWYVISSLDVQTKRKAGAVAVLGNSIADGRGSGVNKQNRWPDIFSQKLLSQPETSNYGVLNLGIGGNCVLRGGLGPTALNRFDADILAQSNVKWLIISIGVNDIGGIRNAADAPKIVDALKNAYITMIEKAHAKGIKVYGATVLPFAKSFYDTDFRLEARDQINEWIRTSGKFDALIDFDALMRNPDDVATILPDVHTGDFLHPNEAGYDKMGKYIDLQLFK